ncbi:Xaa-Pro aminopeptidase [Aggregatibacter actinomycetemcomitans serotype e str. SC1083]|uniref:Xaa-Pro aminopeptidase n=1 Tax=Aggregatibacter actinomycetemcomitans serotype e str. SC1083 TaxID=907488 RepID=G4A654_AGGAC|nr:Xaa-Pro aminopeptidase [Aggregatibacter actinomycetemcomitans]EGY35016.1 Xaa-Pro aminopeptidase [Aggregatibacter actinomycetemcomitans serotype e str. SC1083]KYK74478.1 proline aminopeptidase P II [Aggregatibacter actinomycetemcomitans serotype e str. SA3096]KYK81192.1 proline aminopeptidase P II [Aggregatibacter actinomycetemcomitans serotype e str. SC936]KYK92589.1 proline aminopeptidase P II [Aggregatibacter actinomycetemcomitans serotype e str. ANH9776]TYB20983.1 Xaa-Pro aminopeptidase 
MDLAYMAALPPEEFAQRRAKVFEQMQEDSLFLVFSDIERRRNDGCDYPFRQDSYFWYLTGFNEPNAALLLRKQQGEQQAMIFLRPSDKLLEIWNGRRLGMENALQTLLVDSAYAIEEFVPQFKNLAQKQTALYYAPKQQPWGDALLEQSAVEFSGVFNWKHMLGEMRLFKSENEIALMQQAGQISALAHIKAMQQTRPNRLEYEVESDILHEFNRFGARYPAYNSIVAGGENACILHYSENNMPLRDGDLVLIDAGCEFAMYAGDITRTFPVNGKFSEEQKAIYDIVLQAQKRAIELLVPGSSIAKVNEAVIRIKTEGLVRLGILKGDVDELIEQKAYREFYMHGLGHWLGLDVHDVGDYGENRSRTLEPGMVITVEPGLYLSKDADIPEQYKGIGIRIEDDLLITDYGNKNLTSAAPKEIADIEKLMADALN